MLRCVISSKGQECRSQNKSTEVFPFHWAAELGKTGTVVPIETGTVCVSLFISYFCFI